MGIFGNKKVQELVEDKIEDVKEALEEKVEDVVEDIKDKVEEKVSGMKDSVEDAVENIKDKVEEKVSDVKETTEDLAKDVKQESQEKVEDVVENIKEEVSDEIDEDAESEAEAEEELEVIEKSLEENLKDEGIKVYDEVDDVSQTRLEILSEDVTDRHSIIFFGAKAQENINKVSEHMLKGVQSKDLGFAGDNLNNLVSTLKGFDIDELDPTRKQGFISKIFGFASPVTKFLSSYDTVRVQIDKIVDNLEEKKTNLLTDITSLERLYNANLSFIGDLDTYIAAGAYKVKELGTNLLTLEEEAQGSKKLEKKLGIRDQRAFITALEARVYDLKLSRTVALQALPSIRLIQDNNKTLVEKINSTIVNTLPLWKNQLAQAVTIYRSKKASESIKAAQDFTNELLVNNATKLQEVNKEVTEQAQRGVFDIESVRKANETLIATINESLDITNAAKEKRAEAEIELLDIEKQLHDALVAAEKRKLHS